MPAEVAAVDEEQEVHDTAHFPLKTPELLNWSFAGVFGRYDPAQLQRGLQVYREICSSCHSLQYVAFRTLAGHGGLGYSEEQVGQHFLDNFGYFELVGPQGNFHSTTISAFLIYFGPGLHYRRHWHDPEEVYYVIAGEGEFQVDGEDWTLLKPGDTRFHAANQPHQTRTGQSPLLCLVLWRGADLTAGLSMEAPAA